jgi:hypothetical protein
MQIKDLPQVQNAKIKVMGGNFLSWFGNLNVDANPSNVLFSIPLPKPMTGRDIVALGATSVQPRDLYTTVKTLNKGGLFIVTDSQGTDRIIFVFKDAGDASWSVVSRELEAEPWFGDVNIYSLTKI